MQIILLHIRSKLYGIVVHVKVPSFYLQNLFTLGTVKAESLYNLCVRKTCIFSSGEGKSTATPTAWITLNTPCPAVNLSGMAPCTDTDMLAGVNCCLGLYLKLWSILRTTAGSYSLKLIELYCLSKRITRITTDFSKLTPGLQMR